MKRRLISENKAISMLDEIRAELRDVVARDHEHNAKSCAECDTPGACCLDAHFVNIRISRLEAVAIRDALDALDDDQLAEVHRKVGDAIKRFGLEDDPLKTYACPLYDREAGCVVHGTAKPLPCIHHACYENKEDLPPDALLERAELHTERLNRRVYGRRQPLLPLPVALRNVRE